MISFEMLSPVIRAGFALWGLLLCLTNIGSAILATFKKRFHFTTFAIILFVPAYFIWQVIFDFSLFGDTKKTIALTDELCKLSWSYWLVAFVILTVMSVLVLRLNIRYDRTFITPGTIKLYLDKIPCGICCWRDNGRVLFSNICMNELCIAITGNPLLNGNHFKDAVKGGMLRVDGRVWRFSCRKIDSDGDNLYEMIASDITSEYSKTLALEKDKSELSRLNKELSDYYMSIDETVKRQEILQAKMNIHDEMNRLMLLTVAADKNDIEELNNIFSLWEQNALLLCMEADQKSVQQSGDIDALAQALGIRIIWKDILPNNLNDKQKELFFFTEQEAIVNAVKHAQAKTMEISFEHKDDILVCRFVNDGGLENKEVRFEGGLANIELLAEKQNAKVYIEPGEKFTLILEFHSFG